MIPSHQPRKRGALALTLGALGLLALPLEASRAAAPAAAPAPPAPTAQPEAAPVATAAVDAQALPPGDTPVTRGRYLATVGNCVSCHTRDGGEPFAGGVAFKTDFGTIYSTNITPDRATGIGAWSEADFTRAMHEGTNPQGEHLYPAFPYTEFSRVSDADVAAIFAYLKTVAPSKYVAPANDLRFPYNQRVLLGLWNALYFKPGRFSPQAAQSAEWNRGAYLVEGLAHCGACHTPRNFLGAEKEDQALSGGTYQDRIPGGEVRTWSAVNLTPADSGLKTWSIGDITSYLKTGHGTRTGSFGPMNEVITNSMRRLADADVHAIAVYLKGQPAREPSPKESLDEKARTAGETLYTIHCGTCHLPTGLGSTPGSELGPPLVGSAVVQAADPATLINVILNVSEVVAPSPPQGWKNMKGFGSLLEDEDVASIANYLRTSWGNRGGRVTAADVAKQR